MLGLHDQRRYTSEIGECVGANEKNEKADRALSPCINTNSAFLRRVKYVSSLRSKLQWVSGHSLSHKLTTLLKKKGDAITGFFEKVGQNTLVLAPLLKNKGRRDVWSSTFYKESLLLSLRGYSEDEEFECPICCDVGKREEYRKLTECGHVMCYVCLARYLRIYMEEYIFSNLVCPCCDMVIHPSDVLAIMRNWYEVEVVDGVEHVKSVLLTEREVARQSEKVVETTMVRALSCEPGICWCPVPNCSYGVIVDCKEECPRIVCQNPKCGAEFCCVCKTEWHPFVSCEENERQLLGMNTSSLKVTPHGAELGDRVVMLSKEGIKFCPKCRVPISKADEGGCNKIECLVCGSKFCWLCLKVVTNSHFITPSGCTYLGKKPWGWRGKMVAKIGLLLTGPILAGGTALMLIPSTILLTPLCVYGRAVEWTKMKKRNKLADKVQVAGVTILAVAGAPLVSLGMTLFWLSATLTYIYVVMPISMIKGENK